MIELVKDDEGRIKAFIEYVIFDYDGEINPNGHILAFGDAYVNPGERTGDLGKRMVVRVIKRHTTCEKIFYVRLYKYPDRPAKTFTREQILKRFGGVYE